MLFETPTQFAALALTLVAGWLLGLASHPGGRKWKARYLAERDAHAANRTRGDAGVADANRRVAELERDNARLAAAAPVAPVAPVVTTAAAPTIAERIGARPATSRPARPAYPVGARRGWFDWGTRRDAI